MTVCGIKTRSDDLEMANMTGIESEPGTIDGVDFDTGTGGGRDQRLAECISVENNIGRLPGDIRFILPACRSTEMAWGHLDKCEDATPPTSVRVDHW